MRLFVTGGSGFIGRRFCVMALERGHLVDALVRPQSAGKVPAGVNRVIGTLPYDVSKDALDRADAVVHLAAITTADRAAESVSVNELGTEFLLRLAVASRPRFLFVSTQSAHGNNPSAYATTKRASEELLRQSGLDYAIVRPGLVYGPGETGLFARMRNAVRKMPVLPMIGGGKALVQPIHVDDLCTGLLTILEKFEDFAGSEFFLGDNDGLTLKAFMQKVAQAEGRRGLQLPVPIAPVKAGVAVAESLRLPSPVSMDNLRGLETVERMDTAPSQERLGLELRDLDEGLREAVLPVSLAKDSRIPVLLVGAGKISIVHGLQLRHSANARLAGVVEPSETARSLYQSMGFDAPFFDSVDEALSASDGARAAILATPADTHVYIAEKCLAAGLHVLSEKPLSVNDTGELKWRDLRADYPQAIIHSGYMAAQFPHLLTAFHIARMNKLGHIFRARLVALQTHITASEPVRWEMLKEHSGGGVMINFGCHVASMLFRLIGWPDTDAQGWQWPIFSTEVEDALIAQFNIRATKCTLVTSWSVPGYARPYSLVELECERGTLRMENATVSVIQDGSINLLETQLDSPLAFNMAPDYTGGGFSAEHQSFFAAVQQAEQTTEAGSRPTDYMPPVEMAEALRLENWIRSLYSTLPKEKPTAEVLREMGVDDAIARLLLDTVGGTQ